MSLRIDQRTAAMVRPVSITRHFTKHAQGSVLVSFGDTRVLCTAIYAEKPPAWLRGRGKGWVTAEYAMLPSSTQTRISRDNAQRGRAQEISRLIGRSLRAVTDLEAMGECMIQVDCDVLQADGGTRSAAVTGAWVALHDAFAALTAEGRFERIPLFGACAAVSVGIVEGQALLDLCYVEDEAAQADVNIVMDDQLRLIEVQGTAERKPFSREVFQELLTLGEQGITRLLALQQKALNSED
ncbi:MAG TPA: ribonuclease PH [Candidatus Hydrogenedentes bacterium]|jgi:ribonuclease PH|nr:MAG: Ribonuclease PH [Candidatus Hydrogenedentes bacterium ADurb.Bin170]HOD94727.1 ribonuclease PH [Candidatus Hydrogenedentota bacterium]HOH42354.1 ribonuclease PH [Candidatus Hydrogenedentota bacterium]HOR50250.1 ribonuclease PH [Candidatus Hydrogenedentota bacterium]HPK24308.1 ribonuclease PH [Candidatus Hydrogenedentota bacterium]